MEGAAVLEADDGASAPQYTPPSGGIAIGTSGWQYGSWQGPFYPKGVKVRDQLAYYAGRFPTAEIHDSFYRLPTAKAVSEWRAAVPDDFTFAWKASRYITHFRRLKDCEEQIVSIFARMEGLGETLGPALFQLPPQFQADRERLASFLALLPKTVRHAFEFRHESWYAPDILDVLRDHNAALCFSDHDTAPSPHEITADFVYLRGHGPGRTYGGAYPDETLNDWAASIRGWRTEGREVFVYLDNEQKSQAIKDAERLTEKLAYPTTRSSL